MSKKDQEHSPSASMGFVFINYKNIMNNLRARFAVLEAEYITLSGIQALPYDSKEIKAGEAFTKDTQSSRCLSSGEIIVPKYPTTQIINELRSKIQELESEITRIKQDNQIRETEAIKKARVALQTKKIFGALRWADTALMENPRILDSDPLDFPEVIDIFSVSCGKKDQNDRTFHFFENTEISHVRIENTLIYEYILYLEDKSYLVNHFPKPKLEGDRPNEPLLPLVAKLGYQYFTRWLLNKGISCDLVDNKGMTALFNACSFGHFDMANDLIINYKANVNNVSRTLTALMTATWYGYTNIVELLLEHGADANITNDRASPLTIAFRRQHLDIIRLLLNKGADVNFIPKNSSETPLCLASRHANLDFVKELLDRGAPVDSVKGGPLRAASNKGHLAVVKMLLDKGASIDLSDFGGTALSEASLSGQLEVVKELIRRGAAVNIVVRDNKTALHKALEKGHLKIISLLLEHGAGTESFDLSKFTLVALKLLEEALETLLGYPTLSLALHENLQIFAKKLHSEIEKKGVYQQRFFLPAITRIDNSIPSLTEKFNQSPALLPDKTIESPPPSTMQAVDTIPQKIITRTSEEHSNIDTDEIFRDLQIMVTEVVGHIEIQPEIQKATQKKCLLQ
jgi:ankyrin repeat protein